MLLAESFMTPLQGLGFFIYLPRAALVSSLALGWVISGRWPEEATQ